MPEAATASVPLSASTPAGERTGRVGEQRLGSEYVVGEHVSGRSERGAVAPARHEALPELSFQRGEVLGDRRLADVELLRSLGHGAAARNRRERAESRLDFHACKL